MTAKTLWCPAAAALGVLLAAAIGPGAPAGPPHRPVALALSPDGRWLYVANRRGSISALDTDARQVAAEVAVGRELSDLARHPDGRLLATDAATNQLIALACGGPTLKEERRVEVAPSPVCVRASPDGSRVVVASLWPRRITVLDASLTTVARIDVPFPPRLMQPIRGGERLIVADAFAGQLAVVNVIRGAVEAVHTLPGHNVRGLALSPDGERLVLVHQSLSEHTPTTKDAVHWGNVVANNVRVLNTTEVLAPGGDPLRRSRLVQLGGVEAGAGDPSGVAVTAGGLVLTTLGGVGELAAGPEAVPDESRIAIGRRPTAVVADAASRRAYVADTFGDAVAVVDLSARSVVATIPLGAAAELTPAERGEAAFYDARLSHDGWMSCHSCHPDGHTTGLRNDNLGDGSYGAPKRILSLRGVGDTGPWAWDGGATDLAGQVRKSILTTMHGKPPADGVVRDLTAFLQALPPPPPGTTDATKAQRGRAVFDSQGCARCHKPPSYTASGTYDVGLTDEVGTKRFNPPSLRGVAHGGPFFHDGRAATLADVFTRHRHQFKGDPAAGAIDDLVEFLRSL
ncbi:MAG: cytochrome c peroxidase [Gemmataceae bacterium]